MSSSHHYPLIPRLLFLLAGAFILGGQAGKLHSWQKSQATSASLLSESTSWGLSFQKEGERPVGNATINALGKYHAYYAEDTNERKIYLTFDAGYENGNTPRILDALKKHQAPATFFVVGNFISDNPDLIRRMVSEGHTVGNHTMTHPDMRKRHEELRLTKCYRPEDYPKYDNYDAINVKKVVDIPMDYNGIMGVPITYLKYHNELQFEIIGEANHGSDNEFDLFKPKINGKELFKRILIKRRKV